MRIARWSLAALLVVAASVMPGWAQDSASGTGTLEGIITDPQQVPLPGATVVARSASAGVEKAVMTDANGRYKIPDLPPATDYVLDVSFPGGGYAKVTQDRIVVRPDRTTAESVQLFQGIEEKVIVSAKKDQGRVVQLEEVGQRTEFSAEFLEGLPLLGRNYQDILTLAAGVQDHDDDGNPNVLGARAENFKAVIDGVSNQDVAGGTFASNLNTDTIEAVEVVQTGGDASLGRASGSFANIITKSGSNEFEGTFTLSLRSSLLDGNGQTGNEAGDFKSVRPAVSLSGAIVKDRLWYFLTDEEISDDIPINTLSGRNTLIREQIGRRWLAKLTWQASSGNKFTAQVRSDPIDFTNLGINSITLPEAGFTQEQGGPVYNVSLETVFSPRMLLTSRVAFSDSGINIVPNNPQNPLDNRAFFSKALDVNLDTGAVSGSWFLQSEDERQRKTWREDLTYFVDDFFGRHDIGMGIIYENEYFAQDQYLGMVRTFRLQNNFFGSTDSPNDAGRKFIVNENFGIPERTGGFTQRVGESDNYGAYITDTWLPRENLAVTFGLRWEREEVSAPGFDPFDPRGEFNAFQQYMVECKAAAGQPATPTEGEAASAILGRLFPSVWQAFLNNGQSVGSCSQGKPFFLTFPKQKFTDDCKQPNSNRFCTTTLDNFSPVLFVKGNRPEGMVEVTNNNLSPRFNVSWDPWSNGKTRFFGSWGRFYDKTNLVAISIEQSGDSRSRDFVFNESLGTTTSAGAVPSDPDVTVVNRNLQTEFKDEWTIGFEREIAPETKIRLTWVTNRFRNQLQDVDFNHFARDVGPEFIAPVRRTIGGNSQIVGFIPIGGPLCEFDPVVTGLAPTRQVIGAVENGNVRVIGDALGKPNNRADDCFGQVASLNGQITPIADGVPDLFRRNLLYNNVLFLSNLNYSEFEGFTLEFIRRMKRNWQLNASWTHGRSVGAADNFLDESGSDPSRINDEFGPTGFDIRDSVTVSVTTILPWGDLQLGSVMRYFSGTPYSLRERDSSFDSANQSTFRTTFPTGRRNDQRNEPRVLFDVTLEKAFLIKKYNATAQLLVQNVFADDFMTIGNFFDDRLVAVRDFGRRYEARFKVNF